MIIGEYTVEYLNAPVNNDLWPLATPATFGRCIHIVIADRICSDIGVHVDET